MKKLFLALGLLVLPLYGMQEYKAIFYLGCAEVGDETLLVPRLFQRGALCGDVLLSLNDYNPGRKVRFEDSQDSQYYNGFMVVNIKAPSDDVAIDVVQKIVNYGPMKDRWVWGFSVSKRQPTTNWRTIFIRGLFDHQEWA